MIQKEPIQPSPEDTSEALLSDNERIDLIANLLLDYLDEEQSGEEGSCKTTQTKML
jgi:hypothetical protein